MACLGLSIGSPRNLSSGMGKRDSVVTANFEYSIHISYISELEMQTS
jgi:hypothetical protein